MKEGEAAETELKLSDLIEYMTETKRCKQQRRSSLGDTLLPKRTFNGFRRSSLGNINVTESQPHRATLVPHQIQVRRQSSTCGGGSFASNPSREPFQEAFDAMDGSNTKIISVRKQSQDEMDRASLLASIDWLASHVPICVLHRLMEEVRITRRFAERSPSVSECSKQPDDGRSNATDSMVSDLSEAEIMISKASIPLTGDDEDCDGGSDTQEPGQRRLSLPLIVQGSPSEGQFTESAYLINGSFPFHDGEHDIPDSPTPRQIPRELSFEQKTNSGVIHWRSIESVTDRRESSAQSQGRYSMGLSRSPTGSPPKQPIRTRGLIRISSGLKPDRNNGTLSSSPLYEVKSTRSSRSVSSCVDDRRELALKALGIGTDQLHSPGAFKDPFPFDSDDEKQLQSRIGKMQLLHRRTATMQQNEISNEALNGSALGLADRSKEWTHNTLPYSLSRQSALLFVDISGFTKLSTLLDPESLSKAINVYFQRLVNEIVSHGGDVLKFAGDAIFAEWPVRSVCGINTIVRPAKSHGATLGHCVTAAARCGAKIVAECSDFPIFGISGEGHLASLNVHCGLGAGMVVGIHIGDQESRREFVILGDALNQLTEASLNANLGELVASPAALKILAEFCSVDKSLVGTTVPTVIARRTMSRFVPPSDQCETFKESENFLRELHCKVDKGLTNDGLKLYRKLIALYAHPVVVANDSAALEMPRVSNAAEERHREEAELRSVFVLFITPLIGITISGEEAKDNALYSLLNDIMNLVTRELRRFNGHLRQFIVDDKGVVLIATFGLRGSTFPNMVAERALPCTIVVHNALVNELGVQNQIGATIGIAYCGVVGGISRHEYTVMGPSVNLAARLMSSPKNPGILVDNAVRMMADQSYGFNALSPVKAKGYPEPVPIFEPLSPLERSWGRVQPNFVGRKAEIKQMMSCARAMALSDCATRMIMIEGENGIGKSTLVVHAIEHIRRGMRASRRRIIVSKSVGKEGDQLVPFGMFSSILLDVLQFCKAWASDDRSMASRGGTSVHSLNSHDWESLSAGSHMTGGTSGTNYSRTGERLSFICREMNAPPEFAELIGHHLLGFDIPNSKKSQSRRPTSMKSLISFMTRAFLRCTQDAPLVIIALDDVHNMDEMSWKVVQEIFETTQNMILFCTKRAEADCILSIDKDFWVTLNDIHEKKKRYHQIRLDKLDEDEILQMIAKTLGLQTKDVPSKLHHNVLTQSQGMPHFANEILESIKRRNGTTNGDTHEPSNDTSAFASVGELILHRLDSFDASVRNVLNIGAVLGSTFELIELVAVLRQIVGGDESDQQMHLRKARVALELAVDEGILFLIRNDEEVTGTDDLMGDSGGALSSGGQFSSGDPLSSGGESCEILSGPTEGADFKEMNCVHPLPTFSFAFCHEIWRSTILKLMLDGRQRDIHRTIASTLEAQLGDDMNDYLSRMKLFSHWKACGDFTKASSLAVAIGTSYENLGMHNQSVRLYEDALAMWCASHSIGKKVVRNFTQPCLDHLTSDDALNVIHLLIALAKSLGNLHQGQGSVDAYEQALGILRHAKEAKNITDRSCAFPAFSGLFLAIRFGQIEEDQECSYEQDLVAQFVEETRKHDDPPHLAWATAMQAEVMGRLGKFEPALSAFEDLRKVYSPELHSSEICRAYGSDRAAQCFGLAAAWQMSLGEKEQALQLCQVVLTQLMPQMDERNVHNSCLILYPVLWVFKEYGNAGKAREQFNHYVVQAFQRQYGEGATTSCLPIYEPILILLDLADGEVNNETLQYYLKWASEDENLRFGTVMNTTMGHFGRCPDSISAEICMLLAKRVEPGEGQLQLIQSGLDIILEVVALTQKQKMIVALNQVLPVYKQLMTLAKGLLEFQDNVHLSG